MSDNEIKTGIPLIDSVLSVGIEPIELGLVINPVGLPVDYMEGYLDRVKKIAKDLGYSVIYEYPNN